MEACEDLRQYLPRRHSRRNTKGARKAQELAIDIYFAHPYCSHERGSNENLNGLVRRFFPKKTDFTKVSDAEIQRVEYLLNTRPRKRLGGKTPLEVLLETTGVVIDY